MAYIDPGAGSIVIQVALGAIAGLLFLGKMFRIKIVAIFKRVFHLNRNDESSQQS